MNTVTLTTTQTLPVTEVVLHLHKKEITLESIVAAMQQSGLFSDQLDAYLGFAKQLTENDDIAVALSYLLLQFIHPAMMEHEEQTELLLEIEDQIKELLKQYLPEKLDVDAFIEERYAENSVIEQLSAVEEMFGKLEDHLYASANALNARMKATFEAMKAQLIALKEKAQTDHDALKNQIEGLMKQMETLTLEAQKTASSVKEVGEKFLKQQHNLPKIEE